MFAHLVIVFKIYMPNVVYHHYSRLSSSSNWGSPHLYLATWLLSLFGRNCFYFSTYCNSFCWPSYRRHL